MRNDLEYEINEERCSISIHGPTEDIREIALEIGKIISPTGVGLGTLEQELNEFWRIREIRKVELDIDLGLEGFEMPQEQVSSPDGMQRLRYNANNLFYGFNIPSGLRESLEPVMKQLYFDKIVDLLRED